MPLRVAVFNSMSSLKMETQCSARIPENRVASRHTAVTPDPLTDFITVLASFFAALGNAALTFFATDLKRLPINLEVSPSATSVVLCPPSIDNGSHFNALPTELPMHADRSCLQFFLLLDLSLSDIL